MKNLFVVIVSVLLLAVSQNTNAQEIKNDKTNENVNFLKFYDNEMIHWNFNGFGGLTLNYGNDIWNFSSFGVNINNERIRNALLEYSDSAQEYNFFEKIKLQGTFYIGVELQ